jgi:tetratricopeptide (TPR) repeat protein
MAKLKNIEQEILRSFASRVDRNDPGALNNLGVLYYRKGMYEEAIAQFKEALKIDPKFDLARENLQYLFTETNMEDPNVSHWEAEVEKDPADVKAIFKLGISYKNMGRFEDASEALEKVVRLTGDDVAAKLHLGSVYKARGLYAEALEQYLGVRDEAGNSAVYSTDLGEVYYNLGRTDEAIQELRTAIKLDAGYWRSHFLLSFAYGDNGQLQEALEESRVASKLNPSFQNVEANLALDGAGAGAGAKKTGGAAIGAASFESTSFTLGKAYIDRGFVKEALKEYTKALQEMQDKDRVYIELGKIHLAEKNPVKGMAAFLKALEVNPANALAFRLLGCVYHMSGDFHQAAVCYLQAYRLNSSDADVMNNLGVLLYQVGLREEAERMFKKGLNQKLYHMELNYNFLNCHMLKEEYMMAENLLQRLEAFIGKSTVLYEKRALLHYKMNRMTLALFDIESAMSMDRSHSDALYLKALIFLREDDFKGAIQAIQEAVKISSRYTGMAFFLAMGDQAQGKPAMVDADLPVEPDDDLIELLQCGIGRRFDKIRELLVSILDREIERIGSVEAVPPERVESAAEDSLEIAAGDVIPSGEEDETGEMVEEALKEHE